MYFDVIWNYLGSDTLDSSIKKGLFKALINIKDELYLT